MAEIIDKLAWIHLVERRVLITRSAGKDTYYLPGGKREAGENDSQALIREIQEELSVTLVPASLTYLGTFEAQAHGKKAGVLVRMTCYTGTYTGDLQPAAEIEEMTWFTFADRAKSSPADQIILAWLHQQGLLAD